MHVISRSRIREFEAVHPDASEPLRRWWDLARKATWADFASLRRDFPQADRVGEFTVFNIGGNKYRLIAHVFHIDRVLLIRHILTHADYDRGLWKR